jgi:hypothetical protein
VTSAGKVTVGGDKSGPSHVVFSLDGKHALVTRDGDHRIAVLSVDGAKVELTKREMAAGLASLCHRCRGKECHSGGQQPGGRAWVTPTRSASSTSRRTRCASSIP